jgi:transposase-like protein
MNKRLIWVLSAALLGGVSVAAIAANHGMDKHQAHRSQGQHNSVARAEARLAKLETALKLQDAQRPAWNAFVTDMKALAHAHEKQHNNMQKPTGAVEHMDAMGQMMQAKQADLAKMKAATQTLMAQLKPDQQAVLNTELSKMMQHGGRKGHDRGGKHGHREGGKG